MYVFYMFEYYLIIFLKHFALNCFECMCMRNLEIMKYLYKGTL